MGKVFVCFIRQIKCHDPSYFVFSSFTFSILIGISMDIEHLAYRFDDGIWKSQPLFPLIAIWSALSVDAPHQTIAQATILSLCSQMFLSTCSTFPDCCYTIWEHIKKKRKRIKKSFLIVGRCFQENGRGNWFESYTYLPNSVLFFAFLIFISPSTHSSFPALFSLFFFSFR